MTRTPEKILMVKADSGIVPAAVTGVIIYDAIGRRKFVCRVSKAADHDDGSPRRPGDPGKSAR